MWTGGDHRHFDNLCPAGQEGETRSALQRGSILRGKEQVKGRLLEDETPLLDLMREN